MSYECADSNDMPTHEFVDDRRIALDSPWGSAGRPVCSWDEDGQGACDLPRDHPVHKSETLFLGGFLRSGRIWISNDSGEDEEVMQP